MVYFQGIAMPSDNIRELQGRYRKPITALFVLGCIFWLVFLYFSGLPVVFSAILALLSLGITGLVVSSVNKLKGSYGLYLLGTKKGIRTIDNISKIRKGFWIAFVDWGLVLSFGILSHFIFRKRKMNMRTFAVGIISLLFILFAILQNVGLSFRFISIPGVSAVVQTAPVLPTSLSATGYILYALSMVGGLSFFLFFFLALQAFSILYSVLLAVVGIITSQPNTALLNQQIPGIAPLIPGLTIPLFAGLLALAVLLVVHEFSHGILARLAKIKIKSLGVILFGIIPVGAFVEPDEKAVTKLGKEEQDSIFIAGISANFLFMFAFFIITVLLALYVEPLYFTTKVVIQSTEPGFPAYNVIAPGSIVQRWNGYPISSVSNITIAAKNDTPFSNVSVVTDKGQYTFHTNATGRVGVTLAQAVVQTNKSSIANVSNFFYEFFALSFVLNFLVGIMNLLPLPAFDGWRIYKNRIRSKKVLSALSVFTILLILLLALPWIWVH